MQPVTAMNPSIMQVCGCPTPISERAECPVIPDMRNAQFPHSDLVPHPGYPIGMNGQMCPWKSQTLLWYFNFF